MSFEKALKSEDRIKEIHDIDPTILLEKLGIDSYSIDWLAKTVYMSQADLRKLADSIGKSFFSSAIGFLAYGWTWRIEP